MIIGVSVGAVVCGAAASGLAYAHLVSRRRVRLRLAPPSDRKTVELMEEGWAEQPACPVTTDVVRLGGGGQLQVPTAVPA
jgi:hypothetical protein